MSGSLPSSGRRARKSSPRGPRGTRSIPREEATKIVNRYKAPVFTDRVGKMKMEAVELKYEDGFKQVQPARYPVPYH